MSKYKIGDVLTIHHEKRPKFEPPGGYISTLYTLFNITDIDKIKEDYIGYYTISSISKKFSIKLDITELDKNLQYSKSLKQIFKKL